MSEKCYKNQIGYETAEGEVELLSETTVGQILKGKEILVLMLR